MKQWSEIGERVLVDGESRRQIIRETGLHWDTLKKILTHSEPPGYRQRKPRPKTKLGPYLKRVEPILKESCVRQVLQIGFLVRVWPRGKSRRRRAASLSSLRRRSNVRSSSCFSWV